jgi:hypothetical protein
MQAAGSFLSWQNKKVTPAQIAFCFLQKGDVPIPGTKQQNT